MDAAHAIEIIRPLSEGVDPGTGELLPEGHVVQKPDVIRALRDTLGVLEAEVERQHRKRNQPAKAGMPWSTSEDEQLANAFDGGTSLADLAKAHERTRLAIHARLVKLGRLSEDQQR
ncbi:MAG: hypothetical protein ACREVN_13135 [Gammaproteobacteria bacterium]